METTAPTANRLRVLGAFEFSVGGGAIELPLQAQRVLGLLAVDQVSMPRMTIAGRLWSDGSTRRAQANLRNAVWRVRQISAAALVCHRDTLGLGPDVSVDLHEVRAYANPVPSVGVPVGFVPIALLRYDLLPDWDEDWLLIERERLRQLRIHALERLSSILRSDGCYGDAIDAALAAISAEPLRESAQTELIAAYIAEGNLVEAVRQYNNYRSQLRQALGIDPSPSLTSMLPDSVSARTNRPRRRSGLDNR